MPASSLTLVGITRPIAITPEMPIATYGVAWRLPSLPSQLGIWRLIASV